MTKTMKVTTFEGEVFTIRYDNRADQCWSCAMPSRLGYKIEAALKYSDWLDGDDVMHTVTYYSGSLERIMKVIIDYIHSSEC